MGRYFETLMGQFDGLDVALLINQHVINSITRFADKVLMPFDQGIEMLRTTAHQDLELLVGNQLLQVPINGSETYAGQLFSHPIINLIGGRMRLIVLDGIPNDGKLFGCPGLFSWF